MRLSSRVLTPNGDGINDELSIEYDLLNLVGAVPATLEAYDLSGRRMGAVASGTAESGRFAIVWDGRDGSGSALPPGLYILRLVVETDGGTASSERIISLVY